MSPDQVSELAAFLRSSYGSHVVIDIDDGWWATLTDAAEKKTKHFKNAPWTEEWDPDRNLSGAIGEYGFHYLTRLPFDPYQLGDNGVDFTLPDGTTVDVKATKWWDNPWLRRTPGKPARADIFVLFSVDLERHSTMFVGWATRDEYVNAPLRPGKSFGGLDATQLRGSLPPGVDFLGPE